MEPTEEIYSNLNDYISLNSIKQVQKVIEKYPTELNILYKEGIYFSLAIANQNIEILTILFDYFQQIESDLIFNLSVKIENRAKLFRILENAQEAYGSSDKLHNLINRYYNKFVENEIDQKYPDKEKLSIRKKKVTSHQIHNHKTKKENKIQSKITHEEDKQIYGLEKKLNEFIFLPLTVIAFSNEPTTVVETLLIGKYQGTCKLESKLMIISVPVTLHLIDLGVAAPPIDVSPMLEVKHIKEKTENVKYYNLINDKTSIGLFFSIRRLRSACKYLNEKNFLLFQIWTENQFPHKLKHLNKKGTELLFGISKKVKHSFLFYTIFNPTGQMEIEWKYLTGV